ncbi:MAG: hypothetical protein HYX68_01120 [Planctomycetes bacterium]|nr:hypothetical protein [Planctomycetota bacterium]
MGRQKLRVLVLSDFVGNSANVVRDYLYSFNQYSKHEFFYLHAWRQFNFFRIRSFDFTRFDAVVFFWDMYWPGVDDPGSRFFIPESLSQKIAASPAMKIQFIQDEYRDVRTVNKAMERLGINLVFTCVDEKDHDVFYPKALIPSLEGVYTVLTGYVPSYLEKIDYPATMPRAIDIGYRSRAVPYPLGDLGQEKTIISQRFAEISRQYGFTADISVREEDRIYGQKWLEFLQSSRFSLGTESGASVVDFSGDLARQCKAYLQQNPQASYAELKQRFFAELDGKVVVQAISPRVFESAAFNNTLVLHEGCYSGILHPDTHYIPVKKDYSNISEVVERMRDLPYCIRLARQTHDDIIRSGANSYRRFVKLFDETLEKHRPVPVREGTVCRTLFYAKSYLCNDPIIPKGGEAVRLPTCFVVLSKVLAIAFRCQQSKNAALSILHYLTQSPSTLELFLESIFPKDPDDALPLIDFAKDLRLLSMLIKVEQASGQSNHPFEINGSWLTSEKTFILKSEPRSASDRVQDVKEPLLRTLRRQEAFDQAAADLPLRFQFNHGAVSATSPWPYHLGEDDVYSFNTLLEALHRYPEKAPDVFREILLVDRKPTRSMGLVLTKILWESLKVGVSRTAGLLGIGRPRPFAPHHPPTSNPRDKQAA